MSWIPAGRKAYTVLLQTDYCLWKIGLLWAEALGNWQTCTQTCKHVSSHTHMHTLSGRYLQYSDEWVRMASPQWHWPYHWRNKGACVHVCVQVCVRPSFPPHRIHLKILRLLDWWKLLPFILTVSACGGESRGMGRGGTGMMWVGAQINACFVTAYVYLSIWQYKLTGRSFYHPFTGKTKRREGA